MDQILTVVGGGLAGSEAALQAAGRGLHVRLFEMRPAETTGAHITGDLAELVCSNSLGSQLPDRATGVLMREMEQLGSHLLVIARRHAVPAGGALAVDRVAFAREVTQIISSHPGIELIRQSVDRLPEGPAIIASGPLTSPELSRAIAEAGGENHLYFFDAIAPLIAGDSIDRTLAFEASRYDRGTTGEGDYLNCPLNREEYGAWVDALLAAECAPLREFEKELGEGVRAGEGIFFESCLPVEVIASRGREALAFGPMRPIGLRDPRTGRRPHAVLQLRRENLAGDSYNMVGFQTHLKIAEQERVFRMIPGLARAVFVRHGQMHRNTFICSPKLLGPDLRWRTREDLWFSGQIAGVEGYMGNIATGCLAGINAARRLQGAAPLLLPPETMLGALCRYITSAVPEEFQPMKANFGILPPLEHPPKGKRDRATAYAARSEHLLAGTLAESGWTGSRAF